MGGNKTIEYWDNWTAEAKNKHGNGNGHGPSLNIEVLRLLPTPTVSDTFTDNLKSTQQSEGSMHSVTLPQAVRFKDWGKFEPAIRRWEQVTRIEAPAPTRPDGKDGAHRLSPQFTEWLMGLTPGWLTNIGLTRNEELKACGNGVVPQQAALALSLLDPQD